MAIHSIQVTIAATGVTQRLVASDTPVKWAVFQNNSADNMRVGGSEVTTSIGLLLIAGAPSATPPGAGGVATRPFDFHNVSNLYNWYVNGTQNDVLDVTYEY